MQHIPKKKTQMAIIFNYAKPVTFYIVRYKKAQISTSNVHYVRKDAALIR